MRSSHATAFLVGCVLAFVGLASPLAIAQKATTTVSPEQARKQVDEECNLRLEKRLPEVKFDSVGFSDAIDFLRDVSGANIFVNWRALEQAGLDRNAPVTVRLRDIPVKKGLSIILADTGAGAGKGGKDVKLKFIVDEGVITISTYEDLAKYDQQTKTYDIRDLVIVIPDFDSEAAEATTKPAEADTAPLRQDLVNQLAKLITSTIDPGSWKENGGSLGKINELNGSFIITASSESHAQIESLLAKVREQRGVQILVETELVTLDSAKLPDDLRAAFEAKLGSDKPGVVFIDERQVGVVKSTAQSLKGSGLAKSPRLTLFNGQRAFVKTSSLVEYIAGYVPDTDPAEPLRAVFNTVQPGVTIDVQGTVSADRKSVTLTLRPTVKTLREMKKRPVAATGENAALFVSEPDMKVDRMSLTVSIPDRATAVVGVFESGKPDKEAAGEKLYLLVKPTIVIWKD